MERHLYLGRSVHRDFEDVSRLFERDPALVLEPAAAEARRRATAGRDRREGVRAGEVHVDLGNFELGRAISLVVDGVDVEEGIVRLRFHWAAEERGALFPVMEGELEAYALSHPPRPVTQLSFIGHYQPPLGPLGAVADAVVGARVAEQVVEHFVEEVVVRIERALSPTGTGRSMPRS
ncbi:MAG TPA: hypothetical protein VM618_03325 [Acidimicrobiia bacterium]|nr:hypothetical protein [Acidimicrobiia bacterium]